MLGTDIYTIYILYYTIYTVVGVEKELLLGVLHTSVWLGGCL